MCCILAVVKEFFEVDDNDRGHGNYGSEWSGPKVSKYQVLHKQFFYCSYLVMMYYNVQNTSKIYCSL